MIYQQHSAAEDAPATTITASLPAGSSSFFFSAAADAAEIMHSEAAMTAAALSGSF